MSDSEEGSTAPRDVTPNVKEGSEGSMVTLKIDQCSQCDVLVDKEVEQAFRLV